MIDYEKLRIAHELAQEITCCTFKWEIKNHTEKFTVWMTQDLFPTFIYYNIKDLITKLTELIQPKPKYEVGYQVCVTGGHGYICRDRVKSITNDDDGFYYHFDIIEARNEKHLYPTKQALIEAQIEYWTCLRNDEKSTQNEDVSKLSTEERAIGKAKEAKIYHG